MKREHKEVPEPSSTFNRVQCDECKETQIIYSHATTRVTCHSCGNEVATPTGSTALLMGKKLEPVSRAPSAPPTTEATGTAAGA